MLTLGSTRCARARTPTRSECPPKKEAMSKYNRGDYVSFRTSGGVRRGFISEMHTDSFEFNGSRVKASDEDPYYIVRSEDDKREYPYRWDNIVSRLDPVVGNTKFNPAQGRVSGAPH
eukprot:tig00020930_g16043.t1